jgi:hypothetical protein
MSEQPGYCELCRRKAPLTRHHLIPRTLHGRKRIRRSFSREELHGSILWVCRACHSKIHATFTEMELAQRFYKHEQLLQHEEIRRFVAWLSGKPAGFKPKKTIRRR